METGLIQYVMIFGLFAWSFVNLLYYLYASSNDKLYVLSFICVMIFQLVFYSMVLAEEAGYWMRPYPDFFVDLSYKRNMVFAVLAVIVTGQQAHTYKIYRKRKLNGE